MSSIIPCNVRLKMMVMMMIIIYDNNNNNNNNNNNYYYYYYYYYNSNSNGSNNASVKESLVNKWSQIFLVPSMPVSRTENTSINNNNNVSSIFPIKNVQRTLYGLIILIYNYYKNNGK